MEHNPLEFLGMWEINDSPIRKVVEFDHFSPLP